MPRSVKRASERHSLTSFEGGELLRASGGHGGVARNDLLDQAAHGFQPQRERAHVEQQQAGVAHGAVAGQLVGLDGRTQGHGLVGVDVGQRLAAEEIAHRTPHLGHAGGATHQHRAGDVGALQPGIAQRALEWRDRARDQRLGFGFEHLAGQPRELGRAVAAFATDRVLRLAAQSLFRAAGCGVQRGGITLAPGELPARFWLFTLKALAFIALRSGRPEDARALLGQLARLDEQARIGDDVIATLLASVSGGGSSKG